jgi:hypothetical protein
MQALPLKLFEANMSIICHQVLSSVATTDSPQGVCMAMRRPSLPWDHEARLILVLDGLRGMMLLASKPLALSNHELLHSHIYPPIHKVLTFRL